MTISLHYFVVRKLLLRLAKRFTENEMNSVFFSFCSSSFFLMHCSFFLTLPVTHTHTHIHSKMPNSSPFTFCLNMWLLMLALMFIFQENMLFVKILHASHFSYDLHRLWKFLWYRIFIRFEVKHSVKWFRHLIFQALLFLFVCCVHHTFVVFFIPFWLISTMRKRLR